MTEEEQRAREDEILRGEGKAVPPPAWAIENLKRRSVSRRRWTPDEDRLLVQYGWVPGRSDPACHKRAVALVRKPGLLHDQSGYDINVPV